MAGRPGRRRLDHTSPLVDLDAVFADDALIDSIAARPFAPTVENRFTAARGPVAAGGGRHRPDPIDELFAAWRQELAVVPIPAPPSVRHAAVAVPQPAPRRNRSVRSALSVAAAIAALFIGSTTVGAKDAAPDSPLWGITTVLWPDRAESVASRSTVREALDDARSALDAGNDQDAQLALLRANAELGNVAPIDGREDMQQLVADMWVEATRGSTPSISATGRPTPLTPSSTSTVAPATPTTPPTSDLAEIAALAAAPPVAVEPGRPAATGESAGAAPSFDFGAVAALAPSPTPVSTPVESGPGSTSPAPATNPPSETSSSAAPSTQPPSTQPPSTLPPPSVPIAPLTPIPTTSEAAPPTAPAQSAPVPTPSPSSSPATELAPPADSSTASSADNADAPASALTGP